MGDHATGYVMWSVLGAGQAWRGLTSICVLGTNLAINFSQFYKNLIDLSVFNYPPSILFLKVSTFFALANIKPDIWLLEGKVLL